jgi:hypothetical protein
MAGYIPQAVAKNPERTTLNTVDVKIAVLGHEL